MAVTIVSSTDTVAGKLWAEKFFRKMGFQTIVQSMMGQGDNAIISVKRELEKADGDRVRFHILNELGGDFILGSTGESIEGRENALSWQYQDLTLEEYKIGVRVRNGLDKKRQSFPISEQAEERLKLQVAKNIDKLWFEKMLTGTLDKVLYGGSATATTDITAADQLTYELCSKLKYGAMSGWQSTNQTVSREPLKPVRVDGGEHYVLLVHPYAVYNLVQNPAYQTMIREAQERGKTNPLFSGAIAILDGVIIKTSNFVPLILTGGATTNIPYCRGLFLGAMASCWAWGKQMEIVNKSFGYDEEEGWGAKMIFNTARTAFTTQGGSETDFGCAEVDIACTNLGA